MDETLFLLWFKLHLIVSVTGALSYQGPAAPTEKKKKKKQERGGRRGVVVASSKLGRDGLNNSGLRSSA